MSVNPDLPMELDDGTPVRLMKYIPKGPHGGQIYVECMKDPSRKNPYNYRRPVGIGYFYADTGIYGEADAITYHVLRNAFQGPEEIEAWRL